MASSVLRHGVCPGPPRLQTFHQRKAERTLFSCKRFVFPAAKEPAFASPSPSSSRRALHYVANAHAEAKTVSGEPLEGSPLRAKTGPRPLQLLQRFTPIFAIKWTAMAAIAITAFRAAYRVFYSPILWTRFSWFFVVWPLPVAVAIGAWSVFLALPLQYNIRKRRDVKEQDQVFILAGAFTWLILVPLGLRHGYIQGWPLVLFFFYLYFFLAPAIVKLRQYGVLNPKTEDSEWSSSPSKPVQLLFGTTILCSHWIAAYEAQHIHFSWNWQWPSCLAVFLLVFAYLLHYVAWYFLVKYSDPQVRPFQLVIFGPYRIVRHPIYTSYMLLFAGYCVALRAFRIAALLLLVSVFYYDQRAKIEDKKLAEAFGKEHHKVYQKQTKYKFFPFLY